MRTVEAHVGTMEAELRRWGAKLDELMAKADAAGTEAKIDYRKRVDEMQEKYQAAQAKLAELKAAGSDRWEAFQAGIEAAWSELEDAFRKLAN
jgi:Skp family chaperone for outer membrane proteins